MTDLEKIRLWEHLKKDFIGSIKDNNTRKLYYKTLLVKATQEFGFNPEKCIVSKKQQIQLDDWEKEFVEDIKKAQVYEIDTRAEKRKQTDKEAMARMLNHIETGGTYYDLPKDLQNKYTANLYMRALEQWLKTNFEILEK